MGCMDLPVNSKLQCSIEFHLLALEVTTCNVWCLIFSCLPFLIISFFFLCELLQSLKIYNDIVGLICVDKGTFRF